MRPTSRLALAAALAALAACGGGGATPGGNPPPGATPPLIASFSPTSGAVGAEVTITGLLFADGAANNTVRFGGHAATVVTATPTTIVAVVPAGATTGKIQVTTAGGTGTSSGDFNVLSGLGAAWTTRSAGPRGSSLRGLAFTGARFAAVGSSSPGFQASTDGLVWTVTSQLSSADDVAWDGALLVAVGGSFWVQTSADGIGWTTRLLPAGAKALASVARSPGAWVGVGGDGGVVSSADGLTWTVRSSGTASDLRSVAWGAGRFVAVGNDGAVTTSTDGAAWTAQTPPTTDSFTAVGASPDLAVATTFPYPGSQAALLTSPDGATWTPRVNGGPIFDRVVHAGGRFVGTGSYRAATSADGLAWTTSDALPGAANAIVFTGTSYVAAGTTRDGRAAIFSSPDGLAWSLRAADQDLVALARRPSDGLLVTVGWDTARTSADGGATWTLSWLTPDLGQNYPFLDLVWSTARDGFVALVQVAANVYAYGSPDGRTWTSLGPVPCQGGLAVSDAGLLLVTGTSLVGECVVTSPDGATWTPRTSSVTTLLRGAAASPARLVVVGDGGTILASGDGGATWAPRTSGTSTNLRQVAWTGTEFLALGASGRLLRSPDGLAWTNQPTPWSASPNVYTLNDVLAVPAGAGRLVLVGSNGLVATSDAP